MNKKSVSMDRILVQASDKIHKGLNNLANTALEIKNAQNLVSRAKNPEAEKLYALLEESLNKINSIYKDLHQYE